MKKKLFVYAVSYDDLEKEECTYNISNERFITLAKRRGTVWRLKDFQDLFNLNECPSPSDSFIRFIEVGAL